MSIKTLISLIFVVLVYLWYNGPQTEHQINTDGSYAYSGYQFKSLDSFQLTGRVLSRKDYSRGREAELSSVDLAMGWGAMADPEVYEEFDISQRNRWYFWKADSLPISHREVVTQSANIHIIYANEEAARVAAQVTSHDLVTLEGDLVEVSGSDGWRWRSSLSRTDTGNGSCEVLLLRNIRII